MAASDQKDYRRAIDLFQKFIEQAPEEPRGHYNLAILYYRKKDYASARDSAEQALNLGAKAARRIIDKVDKKLGRSATSGQAEKTPLSADTEKSTASESVWPPGSPMAVSPEEDTVVWDADELEEEVNTEEIEPEASGGHFGMSEDIIFFGAPQSEKAAPVQAPETDNKMDPQVPKQRQRPERSKPKSPSDPPQAKPKKKQARPKTQSDEEVERFFNLGQKAADQKEYLKAIQHFTKVTNLAPDDPRGYYNLAIVSYRLKFYETAREHARRALELGADAAKRIIDKIDAQQETV